MRHLLTASLLVLALSAPAFAADTNVIRVVKDDGTVVEVDMGGGGEVPAAEEKAAPAPVSVPEKTVPAPEPMPAPVPEPAARVPDSDIVPFKKTTIVPTEEKSAQPPMGVKAPESAPPKAEKKKEKPGKKPAKKKKDKKSAKKAVKEEAPVYTHVIPPGAVIDENAASSIALDVAPPSAGYTVARKTFEGKAVFVVTFKTEDGPYDVLVDAASGAVVTKGPASVPEATPTLPGHLPAE